MDPIAPTSHCCGTPELHPEIPYGDLDYVPPSNRRLRAA